MAIAILVSSIEVKSLRPVTAAIKTLAEDDLIWEAVTERLIEKRRALRGETQEESAYTAKSNEGCGICNKKNHKTQIASSTHSTRTTASP